MNPRPPRQTPQQEGATACSLETPGLTRPSLSAPHRFTGAVPAGFLFSGDVSTPSSLPDEASSQTSSQIHSQKPRGFIPFPSLAFLGSGEGRPPLCPCFLPRPLEKRPGLLGLLHPPLSAGAERGFAASRGLGRGAAQGELLQHFPSELLSTFPELSAAGGHSGGPQRPAGGTTETDAPSPCPNTNSAPGNADGFPPSPVAPTLNFSDASHVFPSSVLHLYLSSNRKKIVASFRHSKATGRFLLLISQDTRSRFSPKPDVGSIYSTTLNCLNLKWKLHNTQPCKGSPSQERDAFSHRGSGQCLTLKITAALPNPSLAIWKRVKSVS